VLVILDEIQAARDRIASAIRVTPLVPASSASEWSHLRLKCENLQRGGAFKLRGAFNFVSRFTTSALQDSRTSALQDGRTPGIITYSSGNHGQAIAIAARDLGLPAVVVMPTTAPAVKVDGARGYGAEVIFAGTTSIDRKVAAEALAAERGLAIVPPFDHRDIIAGQGTCGLEIVEQAPDVTAVYVPVGGGGLISGIAAAVKHLSPFTRVIGVEPAGAPKMTRSLAAGAPTTLDRSDSIADGLIAVRPGDLTFAHVEALVDDVVTVTDDEIREAMRMLAREAKLVTEPSGAAALAGALRLAPPASAGTHVAVVSGGNVDPALFASVLA
jgi:threonine dehydratase